MTISDILIHWYRENKRNLPWRETRDPYKIWVSEIILQQTRVVQGTAYYSRFLDAFPDIHTLAAAGESQVLRVWQGLGYYSRARNMHETARLLVAERKGQFPGSFEELLKLKGIGTYTAAAIASICFNEAVPVLDGNVYRVLSRLSGIDTPVNSSQARKHFLPLAEKYISHNQPGQYNQAIMEFGSLQCIPANPLCGDCPLSGCCFAFRNQATGTLPVRAPKVSLRKRYLYYLVIESGPALYLNHRQEEGIWKGLYDFPVIESSHALDAGKVVTGEALRSLTGNAPTELLSLSPPVKHRLTHQLITARFIRMRIRAGTQPEQLQREYILTERDQLARLPFPRLIEKYLTGLGWLGGENA